MNEYHSWQNVNVTFVIAPLGAFCVGLPQIDVCASDVWCFDRRLTTSKSSRII